MEKVAASNVVQAVLRTLAKIYPEYATELQYDSAFQLLAAVILSAQCTDARVNQTTPALFKRFPTAEAMARASLSKLEALVRPCGFYRMKAKALKAMATSLIEQFEGEVPKTLEELITLRGVGRKTASVVLNQAFHLPAIAVDTHVKRVSHRLGWTRNTDPVKVEADLKALIPEKDWTAINGRLILHGRRICKARKPLCDQCPVNRYCAYYLKETR